jgi:hypothetical protein
MYLNAFYISDEIPYWETWKEEFWSKYLLGAEMGSLFATHSPLQWLSDYERSIGGARLNGDKMSFNGKLEWTGRVI